jgi:3-hydroxymyristoyl/3-hydroxydecanoyl-(acyl carrier protein) dehydratase
VPSPSPSTLIDIDRTFLPVAHMRQISRVTELSRLVISGEVDLRADHWVYAEHFPADPIFPGSLIIEAAGQLLALWAWADGQRGRPRLLRTQAEFHHPVTPSVRSLALRGEVRRKHQLYFGTICVHAGRAEVATVTAVVTVLPAA